MGKELFSYRITRSGKLFVYWHGERGKREIVLEGTRAERLIRGLAARATGNFDRGNERPVR
jgi:hypothetical protein